MADLPDIVQEIPNLAFHGRVETTTDALRLIYAAREGVIPRIRRRLNDSERRTMIKSGACFVFGVEESGIKRWTDGMLWSPSRIIQNYLVYREISERVNSRGSNRRVSDASSTASPTTNYDGGISPDDDNNASRYPPPTVNRGGDQEFKLGGLLKKTITVTIDNSDLHLISYYTADDIRSGRLQRPTSRLDVMKLELPPQLFRGNNFRNPLKIEIGPDGRPRFTPDADIDERQLVPSFGPRRRAPSSSSTSSQSQSRNCKLEEPSYHVDNNIDADQHIPARDSSSTSSSNSSWDDSSHGEDVLVYPSQSPVVPFRKIQSPVSYGSSADDTTMFPLRSPAWDDHAINSTSSSSRSDGPWLSSGLLNPKYSSSTETPSAPHWGTTLGFTAGRSSNVHLVDGSSQHRVRPHNQNPHSHRQHQQQQHYSDASGSLNSPMMPTTKIEAVEDDGLHIMGSSTLPSFNPRYESHSSSSSSSSSSSPQTRLRLPWADTTTTTEAGRMNMFSGQSNGSGVYTTYDNAATSSSSSSSSSSSLSLLNQNSNTTTNDWPSSTGSSSPDESHQYPPTAHHQHPSLTGYSSSSKSSSSSQQPHHGGGSFYGRTSSANGMSWLKTEPAYFGVGADY